MRKNFLMAAALFLFMAAMSSSCYATTDKNRARKSRQESRQNPHLKRAKLQPEQEINVSGDKVEAVDYLARGQ